MSNIETLIKNAVKNSELTDCITLVRGKCFTLITVEDFIRYAFLEEGACDTLMNCWKTMGQFDGGINPENGDDDPCNCNDDFVKLHFPKGEGIKIIDDEGKAIVPDTIYPVRLGEDKFDLIIIDEDGSKRRINVGEGGVTTFLSNIGSGANLLVKNSDSDYNVKSIFSSNNSLSFHENPNDIDISVNFPIIGGKNSSEADNIADGRVNIYTGVEDKNLKFRGFQFTGLVTKDLGGGVIEVEYKEAADITIKTFYVNAGYSREDGNGSILRPYKRYVQALRAIVGNGTLLSPEYPNAKINIQTDVRIQASELANPAYAVLEGRCTVNGMTVASENNNYINYEGNIDYPFSSKFLNDKLASTPSFTGDVRIAFNNVTLGSATVKGVLECETLNNNRSSSLLTKLTINGVYKRDDPSVYRESGQSLLQQPIKIQDSISNTTPTVSITGFDSSINGRCVVNEYLNIIGTSQTFLRVKDTTLPVPQLILDCDPLYLSTDNSTVKAPKTGLYRLEVYNAWMNIEDFRSIGEVKDNIGGQDSIFRFFDDGISYSGANLFITRGYIYHSTSNKILSINAPAEKILSLKNCDFSVRAKTLSLKGAIVNEQGVSVIRQIDAEGSNFSNIKETTTSGVKLTSVLSYINGNMYTTQAPYSNPLDGPHTQAKTAGLIQGNIYYNFTTQSLTLIP